MTVPLTRSGKHQPDVDFRPSGDVSRRTRTQVNTLMFNNYRTVVKRLTPILLVMSRMYHECHETDDRKQVD